MSFEMQGVSLQTGKTYTLGNVGTYVPRLAMNNNNSISADNSSNESEKLKYFVIHDTGVGGESLSKYENRSEKFSGTVHGFIDPEGDFLQTTPVTEEAYGTKMDAYKNKGGGERVHIELLLNEELTPTIAQYNKLAEIYHQIVGEEASLIIVPHREVDRGVTGYYRGETWVVSAGHNDPRNFDFNYFYQVLKENYSITIVPGVSGITQERYNYDNQSDMIVNWPPVLTGKPKRQ